MRVLLTHPDHDAIPDRELTEHDEALIQDLDLATLLGAMAAGDEYLLDVATKTLLAPLADLAAIRHRQAVLRDCLEHPEVVRGMYELAVAAIEGARRDRVYGSGHYSADLVLSASRRVLALLSGALERLRQLAETHGASFASDGFSRLFSELSDQLDDEYIAEVRAQLGDLGFRHGTPISARLGTGLTSAEHVLRRPRRRRWTQRLPLGSRDSYSFQLDPHDEAGPQIVGELRARGIVQVANALGQAAEHLLSYFTLMRAELAFYVACLNLHDRLTQKAEPICFPEATARDEPELSARGLYDPCLSLRLEERVIGNDLDADATRLIVVTGANQGGKSTFLRSLGVAQLMMQSGMFVAAEAFGADVREAVFSHFKREEDGSMESGKLDEELRRMSAIVDAMRPGGLLLCNESFAATNEREGSEIARQIVHALLDEDVKVVFVTHMHDLAHSLQDEQRPDALFLRAERQPDGQRTFRVRPGEPLATSYGEDVYRRVFGAELQPAFMPAGEA